MGWHTAICLSQVRSSLCITVISSYPANWYYIELQRKDGCATATCFLEMLWNPCFPHKVCRFLCVRGWRGGLTFSSTQQPQKIISAFLFFFSNEWCLLSVCIGPPSAKANDKLNVPWATARGSGTWRWHDNYQATTSSGVHATSSTATAAHVAKKILTTMQKTKFWLLCHPRAD